MDECPIAELIAALTAMDGASIANVIAFLAAMAAAWAAWESHRSAKAAKLGAEADLIRGFIEEYSQPEMSKHLRCLVRWQEQYPQDFAASWLKGFKNNAIDANEVDSARRYVKGYFEKAARLYEGGYLDNKMLKLVVYRYGINVYFDVVGPIETEFNSNRDVSAEQILLEKVGRYKEGKPSA